MSDTKKPTPFGAGFLFEIIELIDYMSMPPIPGFGI
jgi:hypothetical protein